MRKFCFKCGNTSNLDEEGLCIECKSSGRIKSKEVVKIIRCPHCHYFKLKGGWQKINNTEELIEKVISPLIEGDYKYSYDERNGIISIKLIGKDEKSMELRLKNEPCKICSRKKGGYYVAKVQLRGNNLDKNFDELYNLFRKKERRGYFITKVEKVKNGYDFYLSSLNFAQTVIRDFCKDKKVERKFSKELKSRRGGKYIYRYVISLRVL